MTDAKVDPEKMTYDKYREATLINAKATFATIVKMQQKHYMHPSLLFIELRKNPALKAFSNQYPVVLQSMCQLDYNEKAFSMCMDYRNNLIMKRSQDPKIRELSPAKRQKIVMADFCDYQAYYSKQVYLNTTKRRKDMKEAAKVYETTYGHFWKQVKKNAEIKEDFAREFDEKDESIWDKKMLLMRKAMKNNPKLMDSAEKDMSPEEIEEAKVRLHIQKLLDEYQARQSAPESTKPTMTKKMSKNARKKEARRKAREAKRAEKPKEAEYQPDAASTDLINSLLEELGDDEP